MIQRQKLLIITHAVMYEGGSIHGPAHAVSSILSKQFDVSIISHPLAGCFESTLAHTNHEISFMPRSSVGVIRWLREGIANARYIIKNKPKIIVTIDPVNTFSVLMLQAVGIVSSYVYYTVDFADKRSESPILDWLYHELDTVAAQSATQCWAVSQRIIEYRKSIQGIEQSKLFFVPNSPPYKPSVKRSTHDPLSLVIVSNIHKGVGFEEIFSAFYILSSKHKKMRLTIIGDGQERAFFEKQVLRRRLQNRVQFLGQLSHERVHSVLTHAGVGLALYTGFDPHRPYSDSMKARDYLSHGIPVIISGDLGTAEEIEQMNAGVWITLSANNIVRAVERIIDPSNYKSFVLNARQLSKDRNFSQMISIPMSKF